MIVVSAVFFDLRHVRLSVLVVCWMMVPSIVDLLFVVVVVCIIYSRRKREILKKIVAEIPSKGIQIVIQICFPTGPRFWRSLRQFRFCKSELQI
jgi:hypothetical protein